MSYVLLLGWFSMFISYSQLTSSSFLKSSSSMYDLWIFSTSFKNLSLKLEFYSLSDLLFSYKKCGSRLS